MKSPNNQKRTPVVMALSAALAITLVGLAEESAAAVIAVNSNLGSTYVSTSVSGSFDISGVLAGNTATSGSIFATFFDDGNEAVFQGSSFGGFSYAGSDGTYNYYVRSGTNYYLNPIEAASLSAGASSATGSSSYSQTTYAGTSTAYTCYGNICDLYMTNYNNLYSGYTGNFSITLNLDATALADLNSDGLLGFGISALSGDFILKNATLTANLVENAVEVEETQRIPEPSLAALLGIGLVSLGFSRRSRKQKVSAR